MPVAAAMLIAATTPSRARAPSTVSRSQRPHGTLPAARRPRRRGRRPGSSGCRRRTHRGTPGAAARPRPARPATRPAPRPPRPGPAPRRAASFLRRRPSFLSARHTVGPLAATPARSRSEAAYSASVRSLSAATSALSRVQRRPVQPSAPGRPREASPGGSPRSATPAASGRACSRRPRTAPPPVPGSAPVLARPQHPIAQLRRVRPRHGPPPRAHHGRTASVAEGSQPT